MPWRLAPLRERPGHDDRREQELALFNRLLDNRRLGRVALLLQRINDYSRPYCYENGGEDQVLHPGQVPVGQQHAPDCY